MSIDEISPEARVRVNCIVRAKYRAALADRGVSPGRFLERKVEEAMRTGSW